MKKIYFEKGGIGILLSIVSIVIFVILLPNNSPKIFTSFIRFGLLILLITINLLLYNKFIKK